MNKFRIARAGIDVNEGLSRMCGDVDMFERLLLEFLDDKHYQECKEAINAGNVQEAFAAAHAFKGLVGTLSMTKLYEAVCPMVEVLRKDDLNVLEYLPAIDEAYKKVIDAIVDMRDSKKA